MKDTYYLLMMALNILTMIIIGFNFYSGNEIESIFQELQAMWVLNLAIFTALVTRRK